MKLLGSERTENCSGCRTARGSVSMQKRQRVIRVLTSRIVLKCQVCGTKNIRKTRNLDKVRGKK